MVVTVTTNRSVFLGVRKWFITVLSLQCCHGSNSVTMNRSVILGVREWFITLLSLQCCHGTNSYHEPVSVG